MRPFIMEVPLKFNSMEKQKGVGNRSERINRKGGKCMIDYTLMIDVRVNNITDSSCTMQRINI